MMNVECDGNSVGLSSCRRRVGHSSWHQHTKGKRPESGGARSEITCWHQAEESDAEGGGFRRLIPASDLPTRTTRRVGVFLLYRTYLWNKQQVMSINLITCSTTKYHVVVDHVAFYVIHLQVRYKWAFPAGDLVIAIFHVLTPRGRVMIAIFHLAFSNAF